MGYSIIPKLPRNRYNYVGPAYTETTTLSAPFKVPGGGTGGGSITNTTFSAMSQIAQQYVDEKGFLTPSDVKTVNGVSIVGSGDIEVTAEGVVDLSAYVTKVELEEAGYLTTVPSNYATKAYVQEEINKIPQADLSSYVTKTELEQAGYLTTVPDNYATKTYVEEKINEIPQADLSSYVTKTELEQAGYLTTVPSNYATKAYVQEEIEKIPQADLSSYVTKTELENAGYITTVPDNYATKTYVAAKAQEIISSGSYVTSNDVSNMGYVTTSVLSQASYVTSNALDTKLASYMKKSDMSSYVTKTELENAGYLTTHQDLSSYMKKSDMSSYVTKTELNNASYVPQSQLSTAGYATSVAVEESLGKYVQLTYLDEKLENVVTTSTYTYSGTYYTAKDTDGVIVLKGANTTLTLPTEGITEGKMITVINKTGSSFQAASTGGLINKESSTQQQQQCISYMVSQYIYIEGSWYVL